MSTERLHLHDGHAVQFPRWRSAQELVSALIEMLRWSIDALRRRMPEPDTSIAWEDGEISDDREARG